MTWNKMLHASSLAYFLDVWWIQKCKQKNFLHNIYDVKCRKINHTANFPMLLFYALSRCFPTLRRNNQKTLFKRQCLYSDIRGYTAVKNWNIWSVVYVYTHLHISFPTYYYKPRINLKLTEYRMTFQLEDCFLWSNATEGNEMYSTCISIQLMYIGYAIFYLQTWQG